MDLEVSRFMQDAADYVKLIGKMQVQSGKFRRRYIELNENWTVWMFDYYGPGNGGR